MNEFTSIVANRIETNSSKDATSLSISRAEFPQVTQLLEIPPYFCNMLFNKCCNLSRDVQEPQDMISHAQFARYTIYIVIARFWRIASSGARDQETIVFRIMIQENSRYLYPVDFEPVLYGLDWLTVPSRFGKQPSWHCFFTRQLHVRVSTSIWCCSNLSNSLVETVITRLYFIKRNSGTECMSLQEFRNSPFLSLLQDLAVTPDINAVSHLSNHLLVSVNLLI